MKTHRLFFALWPDEHVRQCITETLSSLQPSLEGRAMQPHNFHITLHFVGQVTEETKDCMHAAAQSVTAQAFQLNLDCFGHFSKAKIFWMGLQKPPLQLVQLHKKLGIALEGCGFNTEERPFTPHVTLLRKCIKADPVQFDFSIPWSVEEFVLLESITDKEGVNYQVIEKYPFS